MINYRPCAILSVTNVLLFMIQTGDIARISSILPDILSGASEIYTDIPSFDSSRSLLYRYLYGDVVSDKLKNLLSSGKVKSLKPIINDLRTFKSEEEVLTLRRVGQMSGRAFTESESRPFDREKDLCAFLEYQFKSKGCDTSAFVPVVAGGPVSGTIELYSDRANENRMP